MPFGILVLNFRFTIIEITVNSPVVYFMLKCIHFIFNVDEKYVALTYNYYSSYYTMVFVIFIRLYLNSDKYISHRNNVMIVTHLLIYTL